MYLIIHVIGKKDFKIEIICQICKYIKFIKNLNIEIPLFTSNIFKH